MVKIKQFTGLQVSQFRIGGHSDGVHVPICFSLVSGIHGCGNHMTNLSGSFMSPGYPRGYHSALDCHWTIEVPTHYYLRIRLRFKWVHHSCACRSCFSGCKVPGLEIGKQTNEVTSSVRRWWLSNVQLQFCDCQRLVIWKSYCVTFVTILVAVLSPG